MTRKQKRALAHLVLSHGYDNLREFWYEIIDGAPNAEGLADLPWAVVEDQLYTWHKHLISLADQGTLSRLY